MWFTTAIHCKFRLVYDNDKKKIMKPIRVTFLHASVPLSKQFTLQNDKTIKLTKSYPLITNVTSSTVDIQTPQDLFETLVDFSTSPEKHCLLKGELARPLVSESRKAMCAQDTLTRLLCLDLDKAPFSSPAEFLKACGLDDVACVWQWSASAKITNSKTISGHIFILLDKPVHPRAIKAWLMDKNMHTEILRRAITLSNSKAALHWPLDVVVNDNGRIIYIAEPEFIGTTSPIKSKERIQFINGSKKALNTDIMQNIQLEAMKVKQRDIINALRVEQKLPPNKAKIKQVGEYEVQAGVGEATTYEVIDNGLDYIRYNLNGGDSQAYWHPRNNFELLHCFKGEPSMQMKEILPARYRELVAANKVQDPSIVPAGEVIIACRDKKTSKYWKGKWNESTHTLDVQSAGVTDQVLTDFVKEFGGANIDYIPEWQIVFDPSSEVVYDPANKVLNTFVPTPYMRGDFPKPKSAAYPTIQKVIDHAVGTGEVQEHFLNWLAVIIQHKQKTGTGWILHGTEGTGKGVFINYVMRPILKQYLTVHKASVLKETWNGWMEHALLAFIDEVEADVFDKRSMEGDLKHAITEPIIQIRRMRSDHYEINSFISFIFSSNKPQPVRIPQGDRRFNVGVFQPNRLMLTDAEIRKTIPAEVTAFCSYLLTRKADSDLAASILQTEARAAIQMLSVTSVDEFATTILSGNLLKLWEYMPDEKLLMTHGVMDVHAAAYVQLLKRFAGEPRSNISRDELRMMFTHAVGKVPEGANKFTTYLRHHNVNTKKIWDGSQSTYGISVEWVLTPEERISLQQNVTPPKKTNTKLKMVSK